MLLPDSIKPGRASVTVTLLNGVFPVIATAKAIGYTLCCKTISIFVIENSCFNLLYYCTSFTTTVAEAVYTLNGLEPVSQTW
jgi:hypothetical protein